MRSPGPLVRDRPEERTEHVRTPTATRSGSSLIRRSNCQPISITACRARAIAALAAAK